MSNTPVLAAESGGFGRAASTTGISSAYSTPP
jgi:hypothetical protein